MSKTAKFRPFAGATAEELQKEARFLGMGVNLFTVNAVIYWRLLFLLKSFVAKQWVIPALYPLLREYIMWPLDFYTYVCYTMILVAGYWAIDKRRRMKAARNELEWRQKNGKEP